ncbi:dihydropyrimidinase-related protein 2 isoform X4 [Anopheles sinensis]|uniref:Dihydropyrimidinase-related protein 2 isoform X4 n=1 Tax=Anopheles sinensis TaxID=74873 RepID=A0A084W6Z1_ANOSI|nr:dihydropyrimidinase-related protein 2 isoform X4 [Anopheles sinensis]
MVSSFNTGLYLVRRCIIFCPVRRDAENRYVPFSDVCVRTSCVASRLRSKAKDKEEVPSVRLGLRHSGQLAVGCERVEEAHFLHNNQTDRKGGRKSGRKYSARRKGRERRAQKTR